LLRLVCRRIRGDILGQPQNPGVAAGFTLYFIDPLPCRFLFGRGFCSWQGHFHFKTIE
jgi:hypothetical protein